MSERQFDPCLVERLAQVAYAETIGEEWPKRWMAEPGKTRRWWRQMVIAILREYEKEKS